MSNSSTSKAGESRAKKGKSHSTLRQLSPSAAASAAEIHRKREEEEEVEDANIRKVAEEIGSKGRNFWPPEFFGAERRISKKGSTSESTTALLSRLASDENFQTSFKGAVLIQHARNNHLGRAQTNSEWFAIAMDYWKRFWQNIVLEHGEDEKLALESFNKKLELLRNENS